MRDAESGEFVGISKVLSMSISDENKVGYGRDGGAT